jgi:hypothetical protein
VLANFQASLTFEVRLVQNCKVFESDIGPGLFADIRLGLNGLPGTNALAYLSGASGIFFTLTLGVEGMKLYVSFKISCDIFFVVR